MPDAGLPFSSETLRDGDFRKRPDPSGSAPPCGERIAAPPAARRGAEGPSRLVRKPPRMLFRVFLSLLCPHSAGSCSAHSPG